MKKPEITDNNKENNRFGAVETIDCFKVILIRLISKQLALFGYF